MGYYVQGPAHRKADFIMKNYDAMKVTLPEAKEAVIEGMGVICVVDNGAFEAAAFCYNEQEFNAFNDPSDNRPKTWLIMDRKKAEELSKFNQ